MNEFIQIWLKNWKVFVVALVVGVVSVFGLHLLANQSESEAQLISIAAYKEQISHLPWETEKSPEDDNQVKRDLKDLSLWLESYDFMQGFLRKNCSALPEQSFCPEFSLASESAPLRLMRAVDTQIDGGKVLKIRARAGDAVAAATLANSLAQALVRQQTILAEMQAAKAESQLVAKKIELEKKLSGLIQDLSQSSSAGLGPTLTDNAGGHLGFLADLQSKAAEVDLKIAENQQVAHMIKSQNRGRRDEGEYGPSLRLQSLRSENQLLAQKKKSLAGQIKRSLTQHYGSKPGKANLTQIKEQFRIDLDNYTEVMKAIEKVRLVVAVQEHPVELFQKAKPFMAKNRWPLSLLMAIGIFLSQLIAMGAFLLLRLWKDEAIAANPRLEPQRARRGTPLRAQQKLAIRSNTHGPPSHSIS